MSAGKARATLHSLLDRIERLSEAERQRTVSARLPMNFADADARADFEAVLRDAATMQAVTLVPGRGELAHLWARVQLADSAALYRFLERTPAHEAANRAADALHRHCPEPGRVAAVREEIAAYWRAGRSWMGLGRDELDGALAFLRALDAVLAGDFGGRDMRTVARQRTGDSKAIERQMGRIARWLRLQDMVDPTTSDPEALAALGLEKQPQDIKLAGPVTVAGAALPDLPHIGLPPDAAAALHPGRARRVVTIENLTSFNRYAREARRDDEIAVYTGGFPAHAVGRAIAALAQAGCTVWHWGDIDAAGLRIALTVARHAGQPPRPWRMTPALARAYGTACTPREVGHLPAGLPADVRRLAAFLESPGAHTLEQEALDPVSPGAARADEPVMDGFG